jgi:hypothetical protein
MPKYPAEPHDQTALELALKGQGLSHLRVRRRGDSLTIESGPDTGPYPHAKLCRRATHIWQLYMPTRSRWEATPFCGSRDELVATLFADFGWALGPRV